MPNFHMHDDLNEVVDEKGNISIAIRKVNWGEESDPSKAKVDIRRWFINRYHIFYQLISWLYFIEKNVNIYAI